MCHFRKVHISSINVFVTATASSPYSRPAFSFRLKHFLAAAVVLRFFPSGASLAQKRGPDLYFSVEGNHTHENTHIYRTHLHSSIQIFLMQSSQDL